MVTVLTFPPPNPHGYPKLSPSFLRFVSLSFLCLFSLFLLLSTIPQASAVSSLATNPVRNELFDPSFEGGAIGQFPSNWDQDTTGGVLSNTTVGMGSKSYAITGGAGVKGKAHSGLLIDATGTGKAGIWVYPTGYTTGTITLKAVATLAYPDSVTETITVTPSQAPNNQWTFIETDSFPTLYDESVQMEFYTTDAIGSVIYFDGAVLGCQVLPISPTEYLSISSNTYAVKGFSITAPATDSTPSISYVYEYGTIDLTDPDHSKVDESTSLSLVAGGSASTARINNMLYVDTITEDINQGGTYSFYHQIKLNTPSTLLTPAAGSTIASSYPPAYSQTTFTWDPAAYSEFTIATDSAYANRLFTLTSTSSTVTVPLAAGSYYWSVRNYDSISNTWSSYNSSSFTLTQTPPSLPSTGVQGSILDLSSPTDPLYLQGCLITVSNSTFSTTTTSNSQGYFQIPLSAGSYVISVSKSGYDTYSNYPFTIPAAEWANQQIAMKKSESYFPPHNVKFTFKEHWYSFSGLEGVSYTVYPSDTWDIITSGTTDSSGSFVIADADEGTKLRIVGTYGTETTTEYITPSGTSYIITFDNSVSTLIPASFFYDTVNITVTNPAINTTSNNIIVNWVSADTLMTSVKYDLYSVGSGGTRTLVETATTAYSGVNTGSHTFIIVDSKSTEWVIVCTFSHPSFGTVEREYVVQFPGSSLPLDNKLLAYLGIVIMGVVGLAWGSADASRGAVLTLGMGWFLYMLGVFLPLGSTVNTTMGAGLGLATAYVLLIQFMHKDSSGG